MFNHVIYVNRMFYMNLLEFLIILSKCNFNYDSDSFRFLDSCETPGDSQSRQRDFRIVVDPSACVVVVMTIYAIIQQ